MNKILLQALTVLLLALTSLYAQSPLELLNDKRTKAGMITYSSNNFLHQSAQNHADYVKTNIYTYGYEGHYETSSAPAYTGYAPWNRGHFTGYQSSAAENMTVGYDDYNKSIDALFTAIYHRLGFLDFAFDEIGYGESLNTQSGNLYTHVYNMGNTKLNALCNGVSFSGYGSYYHSVCAESSFRIESSVYNAAKDENILLNPEIVTWPYENQMDFQSAFFEESPDPLPNCSVSGNPLSIQFNPATTGNISMQSFKLYDINNTEITDLTLLNSVTDPNSRLSTKEFVIFPNERLGFGKKYKTEFAYTEDGVSKTKSWEFYTRSLEHDYFIITQNTTYLNVISGKTYLYYVPPQNCNDTRFNYSFSYSTANEPVMNIIDGNLVEMTVSGSIGQYVEVTLANGKVIRGTIATSDNAISPIVIHSIDDADGDGISDAYELANGLELYVNDADSDKDSDGKTNLQEYQDGTKANDEHSMVVDIELKEGWNAVSFPLNVSHDLSTMNNPDIEVIRSYQNENWYVWTKENNTSTEQALTTLEDGYGYWVKSAQDTTLEVLGDGLPDANITIEGGKWNMIGSKTVDDVNTFFTQNPSVTVMWKYTRDNPSFWSAASSDADITQSLLDANVTQINDVGSLEVIFVK